MTDFSGFTTSKGQEWLATVWTPFLAALTNFTNTFEGAAAVTSTESVAIGTGAKSWSAVSPNSPFAVGATVRAYSAADPTKYMVGPVTASSGASLSINATLSGGSGTVSDWIINAVFDIGFLPLAGGTLTGDLARSGAAGTERALVFQTAGGKRIALVATGAAEGGSNAGTDFELRMYADDGSTLVSTPISIDRATGLVTLSGGLALGGAAITGAEGVADIGGAMQAVGTTASNVTLDLSAYGGATLEPTGNITIAASNYPAGESAHTLCITGGGDHTLDFSHYANAADLPTLQTTTGGDILIGYSPDGGTTKLIYSKGTF